MKYGHYARYVTPFRFFRLHQLADSIFCFYTIVNAKTPCWRTFHLDYTQCYLIKPSTPRSSSFLQLSHLSFNLTKSQSNFPHFKKEQLIDFERRFLLKISFQIVPQTTPSAFVRYLLDLWPRHNDGMSKYNNSYNMNNNNNHQHCNGNTRFIDRNVAQIPYIEILAIADNLMGLFWEGTYKPTQLFSPLTRHTSKFYFTHRATHTDKRSLSPYG